MYNNLYIPFTDISKDNIEVVVLYKNIIIFK